MDELEAQIAAATPGNSPTRVRISPRVREAVRLMVWEGMERGAAAERAGITDKNLLRAFHAPKVKALYAQEFSKMRDNSAAEAFINIRTLARSANSEDVRFRSAQWIAGVAGISPAHKVQHSGTVTHGFTGIAFDKVATIEGQAEDAQHADDASNS